MSDPIIARSHSISKPVTELPPQPDTSRFAMLGLWAKRFICLIIGFIAALHLYAVLLRVVPVPLTPLMLQRTFEGQVVHRDWTPIEDISPNLVYAVIGAEDSRFCDHSGIDWQAVNTILSERAQAGTQDAGRQRGGSTITQQSAKNVFFWNGGGWVRKLPETWTALFVDTVWGKRRTMEIYLNIAEWGDGLFGAEAAALGRFGKHAKDLTPQEAALLASVLPSPNKWRLDPPGPYVRARAQTLLARSNDVRQNQYATCVVK